MTDEPVQPIDMSQAPTDSVRAEQPAAMLLADYDLLGQQWDLISPTLTRIPETSRPTEHTVCSTCPLANWYLTIHRLKCYCSAMRILSWGGEEVAVRACDQREMAIEKILSKDDG